MSTADGSVAAEQASLDRRYARLDELRARTADRLAETRRAGATGTPQNRSERDVFAAFFEDRLARLRSVEEGLCFGRLDRSGGETQYVGRLGLSDDEHVPILVDWRAPAVAPFYQATAAEPGDVVRRRHLATRGRRLLGVEDEVFDLAALDDETRSTLSGEAALLAALGAARTGRMGDIVATIQAEQDRVIRAELPGVLVVQGGPGTGKTAVALHRAAYLLYTHRDRLTRAGVLVVGPTPVFLRYIQQVLPSLGESGVVLCSPGELYPGLRATALDRPEVAAVKGDLRMAQVIAQAVSQRQRVPAEPVRLDVESSEVVLAPAAVGAARSRARRSGRPHNEARVTFVRQLLDQLAGQLAEFHPASLDGTDRQDRLAALSGSPDVRRALNLAWPPLSAEQLLAGLYADPSRLAAAATVLTPAERGLLRRDRGAPWTVADVPLLDEAAELLGADDTAARLAARRAAERRAVERAYAERVLDATGAGGGLVSAEQLAARFEETGTVHTVAERAGRDRGWVYGHVVVDEAQELSAMAWRLLVRRCRGTSMTVVGDLAQTGSPSGAVSWPAALDPHVAGRWRLVELTVNYRTPAPVMAAATAVLAAAGLPGSGRPALREGDGPPVLRRVDTADPAAVAREVAAETAAVGAGRVGVLTPRVGWAGLAGELAALLPEGTVGAGIDALDAPVAVLDVDACRGLEFDSVVLVEPAAIVAGSPRGASDLYVAMTRPTRRLRVLYRDVLPAGLAELSPGRAESSAATGASRSRPAARA